MKKNLYRAGVLLLSGILLCACEGDNKSRGSIGDADREEPTVTAADPTPTPIDEPYVDPPYVKEGGEWAEYFANGEVENNGSYLVRVGNRVYYRVYDTRAVERTRIGTDFLIEDDPAYESEIKYYDLDTGKTHVLGSVNGNGKMYATQYGILIADGEDSSNLLKPDGIVETAYYDGKVVGVSDDGAYVAVRLKMAKGRDNSQLVMMKDDEQICDMTGGVDTYPLFYGFAGNNMVGSMYDAATDSVLCIAATSEGENIVVGQIPKYQGQFYEMSGEEYDFVGNEDQFAVLYGYYDGEVKYLEASNVCLGRFEENSLELKETIEDTEERRLYISASGDIEMDEHAPGDIFLSEKWQGDMLYYDDNGKPVTQYDDLIVWPDDPSWGYDFLQQGIKADDKIITIVATAYRDNYASVGHYLAYDLSALTYRIYDVNETNTFDSLEYTYSNCWDQGCFELDDLQGEWYCDKLIVEGQEMSPGDNGESYRFIVDGEKATLRFEYNGVEDDTEAFWEPGGEFYIDGCGFVVPDDPSEEVFNVINYDGDKIEVRFTYVYDGGIPGSWYGYFFRH